MVLCLEKQRKIIVNKLYVKLIYLIESSFKMKHMKLKID